MFKYIQNFFKNPTVFTPYNQFGRTINAEISKDELVLFNDSLAYFEKKNVLKAYECYLNSLINFNGSSSNENVVIELKGDTLEFTLSQGIALIKGKISKDKFFATCLISKNINVAIKRDLLEKNYQLTYAKFFMSESEVGLKIELDNSTMTPQKIFFPLREIALNSEYEKEFIRSEFEEIEVLECDHIHSLSDENKKIKFEFYARWIDEARESIKHLPSNDNIGISTFTYLSLLMKIDYLIAPHLKIGREIAKEMIEYFGSNESTIENKNAVLLRCIDKLEAREYKEFSASIYNIKTTFNAMDIATKEEIDNFIDDSLTKAKWYKNNRYLNAIEIIYNYIALYVLYNYGMRPSMQKLFHIVVQVHNSEYFEKLGYVKLYENEEFNTKEIAKLIEEAVLLDSLSFKDLFFDEEALVYDTLGEFTYSFYQQIKLLSYE
ncbi:MAG: hypothetical protein GQ570_12630 [Helicobacteraceae bacterium]|nr:hypothetical protein [Helicobacteraceae bacterium]